jgi:type II secretory pathway pseudopilin PulG
MLQVLLRIPERLKDRRWAAAFRGEAGVSLIEVLIGAVISGIAAVGIALMFSTGQAYVQAEGDNRVALQLAQQQIEGIIASGFGSTSTPYPTPSPPWDGREETARLIPSHPGYERTTTVGAVCPGNFALSPASPTACPGFVNVEAKLFTVTVRALSGATGQTGSKTTPVTLQVVLVTH